MTSNEGASTDTDDEPAIELLLLESFPNLNPPISDAETNRRQMDFFKSNWLSKKGNELLFRSKESLVEGYEFGCTWNGSTLDKTSVRFRVLFYKLLVEENQAVEQLLLLLLHDIVDLTFPIFDTRKHRYETFLTIMCGHCVTGNFEKLKYFIRYCPRRLLNLPNSSFETPLRLSVSAANLELVRELFRAGADINDFSNGKLSPFLMSMRLRDTTIYHFFLSTGKFDLKGWVRIDGECVNYLSLAIKNLNGDELASLIMTPSEAIVSPKCTTCFILHLFLRDRIAFFLAIEFFTKRLPMPLVLNILAEIAVERNFFGIIRMLFQAGHDLNFDIVHGDGSKEKLLHLAVKRNNVEMDSQFIYLDAEIDALNSPNCSPLHLAVQAQNYEIAFMLVRRGARSGMISFVQAIFRADYL